MTCAIEAQGDRLLARTIYVNDTTLIDDNNSKAVTILKF
jgi:hypothetical protein